MYTIIASVKGNESMSNEEIKAAFDAEYESIHECPEAVRAEKDAGFLRFEDGRWNQYAEIF